MCGIAGFWSRRRSDDLETMTARIDAMTRALSHRGPDDQGLWGDPTVGLALGHRRLSIIDLSPAGHQPMESKDGRWVIVFNGELYNFRELRQELEGLGRTFHGHSDTEVLIEGFSEWGVEGALRRANAMLALALWDRREEQLWLARDRLGKKPIYYGELDGTVLFGSELKALCAHPAFRRDVDRDALGAFLRYGWLPGPHTIWRGVCKLPAAGLVRIDRTGIGEPSTYWSAREAAENGARQPFVGSFEEAADELDRLLRDAVGLRMVADVPLGALLSGGIDSSLVTALMQAQSSRPIKTFSIGFQEREYDEAPFAAAVARHLGTEHRELHVTPTEGIELIPDLPDLYDEPFADASQIPTFIVSRLARRHVTVALSGDGGDELFAGYTSYRNAMRAWRMLSPLPLAWRRLTAGAAWRAAEAGVRLLEGFPTRSAVALGERRSRIGKLGDWARFYDAADPVELFARRRDQWAAEAELALGARKLRTPLNETEDRPPQLSAERGMMYLDFITYLVDDILVKVDRASMAVALEMRAPLLDWRVVEFAWRLPLAYRLGSGGGKLVLRALLERYLPRSLFDRPKSGFRVPIADWLRGPLRDWASDLLDPVRMRSDGLIDVGITGEIWQQHLRGSRNREDLLWAILMFQAWHERWGKAGQQPARSPGRLVVAHTA